MVAGDAGGAAAGAGAVVGAIMVTTPRHTQCLVSATPHDLRPLLDLSSSQQSVIALHSLHAVHPSRTT